MPSNAEVAIKTLLETVRRKNPELAEAIWLITEDLYDLIKEIRGVGAGDPLEAGYKPYTSGITGLTLDTFPYILRLSWDIAEGATSYQIKYGTDWASAKYIVQTSQNVVNLDPDVLDLVYGNYTFFVRAIDNNGNVSINEASVSLTVPLITAPVLTGNSVVGNAILNWTVPPSLWGIEYYNLYRNGIKVAEIDGTFTLRVESENGVYSYAVEAVDYVGNVSTRSPAINLTLTGLLDFEVLSEVNATYNGVYSGTRRVKIRGQDGIIGAIVEETWEQHFLTHGWDDPQDQINAGFPIYVEPTDDVGTYTEVFDLGQNFKNYRLLVVFNEVPLLPAVDVDYWIRYSEDGVNWSAPVPPPIQVPLGRYIELTIEFDNDDNKSLSLVTGLKLVADTQLTIDSGSVDCFAADVGGTLVSYNYNFIVVNSVTATPAVSMQPLYAVADNITNLNFRLLVFDSSGNRHDAVINWKARGIV